MLQNSTPLPYQPNPPPECLRQCDAVDYVGITWIHIVLLFRMKQEHVLCRVFH